MNGELMLEMNVDVQIDDINQCEYATVHFSDGSAYALVKEELVQTLKNLPKLSGFLFMVVNQIGGQVKIIPKK